VTQRGVAARAGERARPGLQVDVGEVGQRDAEPLRADHQRQRRGPEVVGSRRQVVGPVEADRPAAPVSRRTLVEAVATPGVVGRPGRHRRHQGDRAGRGRRGHDVRHEGLPPVRGAHLEDVEPGGPAARGHADAASPGRLHRAGGPRTQHRVRLPGAAQHGRAPHPDAPPPDVRPDPVGGDPVVAGGRRDHQRDVGPRHPARGRRPRLDLPVLGGSAQPPAVGAPHPARRSDDPRLGAPLTRRRPQRGGGVAGELLDDHPCEPEHGQHDQREPRCAHRTTPVGDGPPATAPTVQPGDRRGRGVSAPSRRDVGHRRLGEASPGWGRQKLPTGRIHVTPGGD